MTGQTIGKLVGAIALIGVIPIASATADDPAETIIDLPTVAETADGSIPTSEAVAREMACTFTGDALTCGPGSPGTLTARRDPAVPGLTRLSHVSLDSISACAAMTLWTGADFTGSSLSIYQQSQWINLTGTYNNAISSWRPGCVGGYLADGTGGTGSTVGLPTNGSAATMGAFDNRASSVKRCPC